MQPGHERDQHALLGFGDRDQPPQSVGRVFDVGVGEPEEARLSGALDALRHGPELAGPAGSERFAGENFDAIPPALQVSRDLTGPVLAAIIDQHDAEIAGIILRGQHCQRPGDNVGLIARRNHCHHIRPAARFRQRKPVLALPAQPESAGAQPQPDRQR